MKNAPGGVETNRASAIQIEVVAFAGQPKDVTTLQTVAQLCRWIEGQHGIQQDWPNGQPRWSTNGQNPGGHNRNAAMWAQEGGHYGHSQVPENDHWDPGYTPAELALVTPSAVFDAHEALAVPMAGTLESIETVRPVDGIRRSDCGRLIERLADVAAAARKAGASRADLRVVSGGIEITLTLDLDTTRSRQSLKVSESKSRGARRRPVSATLRLSTRGRTALIRPLATLSSPKHLLRARQCQIEAGPCRPRLSALDRLQRRRGFDRLRRARELGERS